MHKLFPTFVKEDSTYTSQCLMQLCLTRGLRAYLLYFHFQNCNSKELQRLGNLNTEPLCIIVWHLFYCGDKQEVPHRLWNMILQKSIRMWRILLQGLATQQASIQTKHPHIAFESRELNRKACLTIISGNTPWKCFLKQHKVDEHSFNAKRIGGS